MSPVLQQTSAQEQSPSPEDWLYEFVEVTNKGFDASSDPALLNGASLSQALNVQLDRGFLIKSFGFGRFPKTDVDLTGVYPPNIGTIRHAKQFPRVNGVVDNILIGDGTACYWNGQVWAPMRLGAGGLTVGTRAAGAVLVTSTIDFTVNTFICITLDDDRIQTVKVTTRTPSGGNFILGLHDPLLGSVAAGLVVYHPVALQGNDAAVIDSDTWAQQDRFYFTNNLDFPMEWDGTFVQKIQGLGATTFTCKTLTAYGSYLLLGNMTEDGVFKSYRVRWCEPGAPANWNWSVNFLDISYSADGVQKLLGLGAYVIIYKRHSIARLEYVGNDTVTWKPTRTIETDGLVALGAVAAVRDNHIIMGDSNIYAYSGEFTLAPLGDDVRNIFIGTNIQIPEDFLYLIHATYIPTLDEVWFIVPWLIDLDLDAPFSDGTYFTDGSGFTGLTFDYRAGRDTQYMLRFSFRYNAWTGRLFNMWLASVSQWSTGDFVLWKDLDVSWDLLDKPWNSFDTESSRTETIMVDATHNEVVRSNSLTGTDLGAVILFELETREFTVPNRVIRIDRVDLVMSGYGIALDYSTDGRKTWRNLKVFDPGTDLVPVRVSKQFVCNRIIFRLRGAQDFRLRSLGFRWKFETITGMR